MRWTLILALISSPAFAELDQTFALWGVGGGRSLVDSPFNPDNLAFRLPERFATLEARPDVTYKTSIWQVTARPRFALLYEKVEAGSESENRTSAVGRWSEGFAAADVASSLRLTYGLQNFQWGPGESASPSNHIFRDSIQVKDVLYVTKGKHLLRLNWTPSTEWSEILMYEPSGNGDDEFEAREPYARKALSKTEFSWNGGADYAGAVLGWRERAGFWFGEYIHGEIFEGLSLYTDASHQRGSLAYYPVRTSGTTVLSQSRSEESRVYTFAVTGVRYAFENGEDLRFEWIYQEAGYSSEEFDLANDALTSREPSQLLVLSENARSAKLNGLEFPGRSYLFSSLRVPNAWSVRDWNVYGRVLHSLVDSSNTWFLSSENAVGDHGTFLASLAWTTGAETSELRGLIAVHGLIGYRSAW